MKNIYALVVYGDDIATGEVSKPDQVASLLELMREAAPDAFDTEDIDEEGEEWQAKLRLLVGWLAKPVDGSTLVMPASDNDDVVVVTLNDKPFRISKVKLKVEKTVKVTPAIEGVVFDVK